MQLCTWSHIIPRAQGWCFLTRLRFKRQRVSLFPSFLFLASTIVYCSALIDAVTFHKAHVAQTGGVSYAYAAHLAVCRCVCNTNPPCTGETGTEIGASAVSASD